MAKTRQRANEGKGPMKKVKGPKQHQKAKKKGGTGKGSNRKFAKKKSRGRHKKIDGDNAEVTTKAKLAFKENQSSNREVPKIKGAERAKLQSQSKVIHTDESGKSMTVQEKRKAVALDSEKNIKPNKTRRKEARKELNVLYAELTNPGRKRKTEDIVADVFQEVAERSNSLTEFCCSQAGSRLIQACLKWGSRAQRQSVLQQLAPSGPQLASDRYGHAVVPKLLSYCGRVSDQRTPTPQEKEQAQKNIKSFLEPYKGKALINAFYHRRGCSVLNSIYFSDLLSTKQKRRLFHAIAVPQTVSLLRPTDEVLTLRQLCQENKKEGLQPEQRKLLLEHLRECLEKSVDKELLSFEIIHLMFQAFCQAANQSQMDDLVAKCMDGAVCMLSSKAGAESCLRLLGTASAKQKKTFCQDLKGKFVDLATNAVDYVLMMRLFSIVDDTVMITKTVLKELIPEVGTLASDKYGTKVLLWLLSPGDKRLFSPYELESVALPAPSSLKNADQRQKELLRSIAPAVRDLLMERKLSAAADQNCKDLLVAYLASNWDGELVDKLVGAVEVETAAEELGALDDGTTTTTLITLLRMEPKGAEPALAQPLWNRAFKPQLKKLVLSRCSFVLLELLKGNAGDAVRSTLRAEKKALAKAVASASAAGKTVAGAEKLLSSIEA
eukprot:gnl/MRDRNA2_/MRDRNA2_38071_c0_seq1.p1 gnl/MRDRNA2_/MRDRNA2_38071_c0~~gnl/MRDRNA2_/MRDRNA2_38071_c0_seq1.p1  ORF type:complete len:665 (-),score=157.08 gnl/MRDRNA2_/MRDRNA2_38071_c0_seq1:23-2017(-)